MAVVMNTIIIRLHVTVNRNRNLAVEITNTFKNTLKAIGMKSTNTMRFNREVLQLDLNFLKNLYVADGGKWQ